MENQSSSVGIANAKMDEREEEPAFEEKEIGLVDSKKKMKKWLKTMFRDEGSEAAHKKNGKVGAAQIWSGEPS